MVLRFPDHSNHSIKPIQIQYCNDPTSLEYTLHNVGQYITENLKAMVSYFQTFFSQNYQHVFLVLFLWCLQILKSKLSLYSLVSQSLLSLPPSLSAGSFSHQLLWFHHSSYLLPLYPVSGWIELSIQASCLPEVRLLHGQFLVFFFTICTHNGLAASIWESTDALSKGNLSLAYILPCLNYLSPSLGAKILSCFSTVFN